MRKLTYIAVFEPSETGYGVYFPDLPGCVSVGGTFEEAHAMATEALELHVYDAERDGEALPTPSGKVEAYPETNAGYLLSPVTIYPDIVKTEFDNKAVKTNITLPSWLKDWAMARGVNLSGTLQAALLQMYERR
jgi:predicted RNase H-like HicB family nuclease